MRIFRRQRRNPYNLDENTVFVVGDSHSRAFAHNQNFFPLFLGPGKKINFTDEEKTSDVRQKLKKALGSFKAKKVLTYFGEPDTRWLLGKGWYPWDATEVSHVLDAEKETADYVKRYADTVTELLKMGLDVAVMNVTPSIREEQNQLVKSYNEQLSSFCQSAGVPFLSINDHLFNPDGSVNQDYCADHVHLNNKIQPLVETRLEALGWIPAPGYQVAFHWDVREVQAEYEYNERFGCFVPKTKN